MECDYSSPTIYEDFHPRTSRLLEKEHHAASVQLKKYSGMAIYEKIETTWRRLQKYSKTCDYSAAKSSGACQTRGHGVPDVARFSTRYGIRPVSYPLGM